MDDRDKKDFTTETQAKIPEATALAENGNLQEAIDQLFSLEKLCRLGNDLVNLKEICITMVKLCKQHGSWEQLTQTIALISKRRSQNKQAVVGIVQEAMSYIDDATNDEDRESLIVTLRDVSDGKIFVEAERTRLTSMLAVMKEGRGDAAGAADTLNELHVETYGSLTKKEKADYILEQVRMTLAKKDYIRAYIVSKKLNKKVLNEEDFNDQKIKYYRLMAEYQTHERAAWELANVFHSIFDTKKVQDDNDEWMKQLRTTVLFTVLSEHTNEQSDFLHRLKLNQAAKLETVPEFESVVRQFTTREIIPYPLAEQVSMEAVLDATAEEFAAENVDEVKAQWRRELKQRVVEHNIRVIAKNYTRARMGRIAELLGLPADETETSLSAVINSGSVYARIDRPAGIVDFSHPKQPEEIMSEWGGDIKELLVLVERTCHLISKENTIHGMVR